MQLFFGVFLSLAVGAQEEILPVTPQERQTVIDSIGQLLLDNYIFPDKAKEMSAFISQRLTNNQYTSDDPLEFAAQLTDDLRSISKDLHLGVDYNPEMILEMARRENSDDSASITALWEERARENNYGFREVKMLSKGVGYLKLDGFSGSSRAGETAAAAMKFLSGSKAVIIDLRENGGGSPDMIQFLSTYFFDQELVHLNSFYYRPSDETTQRWTLPFVPGERMSQAKVFILTSKNTFSAAEEFTYNFKNLRRAVIIGENTGGGAHPGGMMPASARFAVFVPTGRAINPITGTNWEGTGIAPDIEVPAGKALDKAHYLAVRALSEEFDNGQENPYAWAEGRLRALAEPCLLKTEAMAEYVGDYGARQIKVEDDKLYYQRDQGPARLLICMEPDLFMMEEIPYFRLRFLRDEGEIVGVEGIYESGRRDMNGKVKSP